jgi:hypothetical protein
VSALADDLRSYLVMDSYDVIIGHSLGGAVALALLPFLPKEKEVTVILVDPALDIPDGELKINEKLFVEQVMRIRTPDEHMAENPAWSRRDCVLRMLGLSMCNRPVIEKLFQVNFQMQKLQASLTSSAFVITSTTSHGLTVACSKTSRLT